MKQIADSRGHVVFVRMPFSPEAWEAACECGYRSAKYKSEDSAEKDAKAHAKDAPVFHKPAARKKAR